MSAPLLEARGLRHALGGREVVHVDELDVAENEVVALLGPNGAGKSTLLRLLLLLEPADAGTIRFRGRPVRAGDAAARAAIAATLQRPSLFGGSILHNAAYGLRVRGVARADAEARARAVLEEMELAERADDDARALSGGEAQRVAVARALAVGPDLLALDEPTAGFDVVVRRSFRERLERLIRRHARACVLVTHDPAEALALADRVYVLEAGRVVQVGSPDELVLSPATPFVATFTGAELLVDGVVDAAGEGTLTVRVGAGEAVLTTTRPTEPVAPGVRVHVAYRPEDVMLAPAHEAAETSARNRLRLRVVALTPTGGLIRVRLDGDVALAALVTREAADGLALAPGRDVVAMIKATALRAYPADR